jgi:LysM repeat protein
MSAESVAVSESALDEARSVDGSLAGAPRRVAPPAVRPSPARQSPAPQSPARRSERAQSWNVLTEELLSFPHPSRHATLDALSAGDAARARNYGEAWLERELLAIRYMADSGYPAASRRSATEGSSALALPLPQQDDFHVVPRRSRPAPRPRRDDADEDRRASGAAVVAPPLSPSGAITPRGWRRLLPGVATLVALAGIWAGAGLLSAVHARPLAVLPGSVKAPGGYVYVVRPGDTLWSIATRLDPSGDPRTLVAQLEAQVHTDKLVPGSRITVP